jgi:hypothetical protein
MMIRAAIYDDPAEVLVTIDRLGLLVLIRSLLAGDSTLIPVEPSTDPNAVERPTYLKVESGPYEKVLVSFVDGALSMVGTALARSALAERLHLFGEYNDLNDPGMHTHINPDCGIDGRGDLDPRSLKLLVAGPVPESG